LGAKVKQKRNYNELYSQNKESENMNWELRTAEGKY
jgi:hypothetical protein